MLLNCNREVEQSHEVGDRGPVEPNLLRDLVLTELELGRDLSEGMRLLHRVEILALEVLDHGEDGGVLICDGSDDHRHTLKPSKLGCTPATLASDDLIAVAVLANEDGLKDATGPDGVGQLG